MVAFAISQPEDVDVNEISFPANTPTTVIGIWKSHMSISRRAFLKPRGPRRVGLAEEKALKKGVQKNPASSRRRAASFTRRRDFQVFLPATQALEI